MSLILEGLRHIHEVSNIFHINNNLPISTRLNDYTEQRVLPSSIKEKARIIAENVRNHGEQKFGPMWAQGYAVLPDDRMVFLQQSQRSHGTVPVNEALEINILPTVNDQCGIHIRYDLERDEIDAYERRQQDGKPVVAYGIYDRPHLRTRVPGDLTFQDIVGPVGKILQLVEIASNKIIWMEPEPSLVIPAFNN